MTFVHNFNTLFLHCDVRELQNDDDNSNNDNNNKYGIYYVWLSKIVKQNDTLTPL